MTAPQPTVSCQGEPFRLYLSREAIAKRVHEIGEAIDRDYAGKRPILIGVLNGAYIFLSDLMRSISIECEVDFMKLSSYGAAKITSGVVEELKSTDAALEGRHVIVVEDIVDTGLSMQYILEKLQASSPASIQVATLLHKKAATRVALDLKYVGFEIDNLFVLGYGLDYGQLGRNLPDIYIADA
ncbi:MAG: hypoxanthine phosphoribosyltransferase [Bacteroidota bacterium]